MPQGEDRERPSEGVAVKSTDSELTVMEGGPYDGLVLRIFTPDRDSLTVVNVDWNGHYRPSDSPRKAKSKLGKKTTAVMRWEDHR